MYDHATKVTRVFSRKRRKIRKNVTLTFLISRNLTAIVRHVIRLAKFFITKCDSTYSCWRYNFMLLEIARTIKLFLKRGFLTSWRFFRNVPPDSLQKEENLLSFKRKFKSHFHCVPKKKTENNQSINQSIKYLWVFQSAMSPFVEKKRAANRIIKSYNRFAKT